MIQLLLTILVSMAIGQTEPATEAAELTKLAPPPKETQGKKIVVTGSYIKRIDEEGPSAVVVFKKEDLQKTGLNSVGDVLRDSAVITAVGRESSGSSEAGVSTASLRAFGGDDILVLLNGLRLPKFGGGNSVDLNLIPISALERVEVLKDGASATYGSDAVGGVINFITKKDYNSTDGSINFSVPEEKGGSRFDATLSSGYSTDKWSVMGVLQFRKNEAIFDKDRYYSKMENPITDGSIFSSPGTWEDDNGLVTTPGCTVNDGGFCSFDFTEYSSGVPDLNQYSALVTARYNFSENLKLTTSQVYNYKDVFWRYAPAPDMLTFSNAVASTFGLSRPPVGDVTYYYRLVEELGTRDNVNITESYTGQTTLEGKFAPTWDWEASAMYGIATIEQTGTTGYANKAVLQSLAATGDFNPNLPSGSKSDLTSAIVNPFQQIKNIHYSARFVTSAPVYDGGDYFGPIAVAAGLSADWQSYFEDVDSVTKTLGPDNRSLLFGGSGSAGRGERNFQAAFTEISMFPVDDVEVQLAGRYDSFSDFGTTLNPKLSVSWQASKAVLLRTSVGTGFRAPNLDSLYSGESYGNPAVLDRKGCANGVSGTCRSNQYELRSAGNPDLKEERSFFYAAGLVVQPQKNWNITVDGWGATIKDQVGLPLGEATFIEKMIDDQGGNGRQYLIDNYGLTINRNASTGRITGMIGSVFNVGESMVSGVDIGINHEKDIVIAGKGVKFLTNMEHTQFFKSSSVIFEEVGPRKNNDVFWKNTFSLGLRYDNQTLRVTTRTITGGDKAQNLANIITQDIGYGSLPVFTQYDVTYVYANLFKGNLSVGVRNIFDSKRPIDDTTPVPNRLALGVYDPNGRTYQLGYSFGF